MIIGFAGFARSGKHEAARALEPEYKVVAFADKLRELLYTLNPILDVEEFQPRAFSKTERVQVRLRHVIDPLGWDGYKETKYNDEIRRLIQTLGTDCGRGLISDTIWIDALFKNDHSNLAIADCRFRNEIEAIRSRGGRVLWVDRPGVGPLNNHSSENSISLQDCDFYIRNSGSVENLHDQVRRAVKYFSR